MQDLERRRNLAKFIADFPGLLDELFAHTAPTVRTQALLNSAELNSTEVQKLWDRAKDLSKGRIHAVSPSLPRCLDKDTYTEQGARAKASEIWNEARVEMRAFKCPVCGGYHLTAQLEH